MAATYDYDAIIIGGGSGGLACAKEAAKYGARIAVLDYVKPSSKGSTWGIGGTCVNVGCIPKKLMHRAAIIGDEIKHEAESFGWKVAAPTHNWGEMVSNIQNHIKSLNWGAKVDLMDKKVKYINAYGTFVDAHTIECTSTSGKKTRITGQDIICATGCRPRFPTFPGAEEHCISSDDVFSLPQHPGKCLIVGASYVALECAGFLHALGCNVTVMVRSILLRGFDQQIADMIGAHMESIGIKFIKQCIPSKVERVSPQNLKVFWEANGTEVSEEFNTVLCAIGRYPLDIGADAVGIKRDPVSGKFITVHDQTSVPNIYAIGDIQHGAPELTPTAIRCGQLLARRLFASAEEQMNYENVPTTVFTPLEYGCCGLSEEKAKERYGGENVEVYHSTFKPLEWTVPHNPAECYVKLIVLKTENERVIGFHCLAPNAGEITQGYAVAMNCGATKRNFDSTVGIHPTTAEEFTTLTVAKSSGAAATKGGC